MLHDGAPFCATGTFTIVCCMMRLDLCEKARLHALLSDIMCTMDSPDGITGFGDSVGTGCMCQRFGSYDTLETHCKTNFNSILNSLVHHPQKYVRKKHQQYKDVFTKRRDMPTIGCWHKDAGKERNCSIVLLFPTDALSDTVSDTPLLLLHAMSWLA